MSDPNQEVIDKVEELFKDFEKLSDEDSIKKIDDLILYLAGVATNANPMLKHDISSISLTLGMMKQFCRFAMIAKGKFDQLQTDLNNALGRISTLEEKRRFDDPSKMV